MVGVPVHCPHCGGIFASRALHLENVRNVTLQGNRETCPRCGKLANIVDGTFNATGDVLQLLSGPQFTRDILRKFSDLIQQAAANNLSDEALREQAAAISPELGEMVKKTQTTFGSTSALLLFLVALIIQSCDFSLNVNLDVNELWDQMVRQTQSEVVLEAPPSEP